MREVLNAAAWLFLATAFIALGADAYWTWKAHHFAYQPIGFYLDLAASDWLAHVRDWAADRSPRTARMVAEALTWPVWAPCFAIGVPLAFVTRPRR